MYLPTSIPACFVLSGALALGIAAGSGSPSVPDALRPAPGETYAMTLVARGVQVYECRAAGDASRPAWALLGPEADLFDARGVPVARHGPGQSWEAADGSGVRGTVEARADSPTPNALPWLRLSTRSTGSAGALATVSSIQRVNTAGGLPPARGCTHATRGRRARVTYSADYRLFTAR